MSSLGEDHMFTNSSDSGFASFFYQLFIKSEYTDIYFNVEYENTIFSISAHKFVLAVRSHFFADKFEEDNAINFIPLKNINPKYLQATLSYMYDYIPPMRSPEEICGIYRVAKEFQVISLMDACCKKLNKIDIVPSNMFDMLKAADYLENTGTKNRCLKVFQESTREVIAATDKLNEISPSMISFMLTSKKLSLDSLFYFFTWIFAWAKTRCVTDNRFSSSREALEEFLPQLPFASLKVEQFADLHRCHPEFFNKNEVIQIFMNYALPLGPLPHWYNKDCQIEIKPKLRE